MKKSVGALLVVSGLAIVGYYLLTLTKPKDRETQLTELDKKAKDLATSMIDVDTSNITKAKPIFQKIVFWRDTKGSDAETLKNKALLPIWVIELQKLGYHVNGTELIKD